MTTPSLTAEIIGPDGRPIRVRPAGEDDAAAILAFLSAAGGESPFLSFGPEGPGRSEAEERTMVASVAASDNRLVLVAERDGEIVAWLSFRGGARARIRHVGEFGITVARSCQGAGLGRRMIEMLLQWAARNGVVRKINLLVRADNARAIALYESLGFACEGRLTRDTLLDGRFHDAFFMGCAIDPIAPGGDA